jgi:hypothetical protein
MTSLSSVNRHFARYHINIKPALLFGYLPEQRKFIFILLAYYPIYWYTYHPYNLSLNMMNLWAVNEIKLKDILGRMNKLC